MLWRVRQTWDGRPLPAWAQASARVYLGARPWVEVDAPWHGDPPPPGPPGPTWALWEQEVVEVFLLFERGALEIELGPHGHSLGLWLRGPRDIERQVRLRYVAQRYGDRWRGRAQLPVLPAVRAGNAFAIWGQRTYAVADPLGTPRPDFHRFSAFRGVGQSGPACGIWGRWRRG